MSSEVPLRGCQRVIASIWFGLAGTLFAMLVFESLTDHFGSSQGPVLSWFLSSVSPSLGLIVAVLAMDAQSKAQGERTVDSFFYKVAVGLSSGYLLALWAVVVFGQMRNAPGGLPDVISQSGQWLSVLQGLVTASLGVFFVKRKDG